MKKVFVVGGQLNYAKWIKNHTIVENIEDADIIMFTGGEDVDPSLYNSRKHPTTYSNLERDLAEKAAFEKVRSDQLCVGVCRGSQLLCCLNGGKLIQNCNNHATYGTHPIISKTTGERYEITSTHHQMQYPFKLNSSCYKILYYASRRSEFYEGDGIDEPSCEPEVVIYTFPNKPKCLAIQGHPEMMRLEAPVIEMLNDLICNYTKNIQ